MSPEDAARDAPGGSAANGHKRLVMKLAEVMAAVERVPKRGHNDFHGYDYATEADIAATIRTELSSRHIILLPGVTSHEREKVGDKGTVLTTLGMSFTFLDGETGEELTRPWAGAGTDKEDKGLYKAMTGGEKFFLLKSFLMPTGNDPEMDTDKKPERAPRRQPGDPERKAEPQADTEQAAQDAFPAPLEIGSDAEVVARFRDGETLCPVCQKADVRKSRERPEWYCWAKKGGCGAKWPELEPGQTAKPAVHTGTITKEVFAERERLLTLAGQISDELQASAEDRKTWWNTYCPGATKVNVDPKALSELVGYLNLRLDKAKAS